MVITKFTVKLKRFGTNQTAKFKDYNFGLLFEAESLERRITSIIQTFKMSFYRIFLVPYLCFVIFIIIAIIT